MQDVNALHSLARLGHLASVLLETDGVDADEAGGVLGSEVTNLVHGGLLHVVELLGVGPAAENTEGALVATATDGTVDRILRGLDALEDKLGLGREVETVVENLFRAALATGRGLINSKTLVLARHTLA